MYDEEKAKVATLEKGIAENIGALKIEEQKEQLEHLQKKQSDPELYNDFEKLKAVNIEIKKIENSINPWFDAKTSLEDLKVLIEMSEEENDESHAGEISSSLEKLEADVEKLELVRMFKDEGDNNNSFLSIHSGAGGTESCDWAMMIFRMYMRWAEQNNFDITVMELNNGEEAGIKSATIHIRGAFAHGYLKSECGVHRLVRISPFDSNKRRHTSFCSVYSTPEVDDTIEVNINPADLRVDTFRAAGAGGQHVNTTDSAVRITHNPTGIVVSCQAERSQHQNKERAMKILRSKLYEHLRKEKEAELNANAIDKQKIEWGSQIRSYVFHPYNMVKDHRTNYETSDVNGVMDGALDDFIRSFLKL